jgi:hypothetical protein
VKMYHITSSEVHDGGTALSICGKKFVTRGDDAEVVCAVCVRLLIAQERQVHAALDSERSRMSSIIDSFVSLMELMNRGD